MENLDGNSLADFLDLAVRHDFISSYEIGDSNVVLLVDGKEHVLDHHQAWSWVSSTLYEWCQQQALNAEA